MAKDRKTLTDADIVSQRAPGRRAGRDNDADGARAATDHDAGRKTSTDAAHDRDKVKDQAKKSDRDKKSDHDKPA